MSPILFSIPINQLLDKVKKAGTGILLRRMLRLGVLCLLMIL